MVLGMVLATTLGTCRIVLLIAGEGKYSKEATKREEAAKGGEGEDGNPIRARIAKRNGDFLLAATD